MTQKLKEEKAEAKRLIKEMFEMNPWGDFSRAAIDRYGVLLDRMNEIDALLTGSNGSRHPDFTKIFESFKASRNGVPAQTLYRRFIKAYELDETKSYSVGQQKRLQKLALQSKMHVALKKRYPMIDWDSYVTGRKREPMTIEIMLEDLSFLEFKPDVEVVII